jgi:hypothetical protein
MKEYPGRENLSLILALGLKLLTDLTSFTPSIVFSESAKRD